MIYYDQMSRILILAKLAVSFGILVHFGTCIPGMILLNDQESFYSWSVLSKLGLGLVPNLGFTLGLGLVLTKESDSSGGLGWDQLTAPVTAADPLSLAVVWTAHLLSSALFLALVWYLDSVRPGPFGIARKLYFPFQVRQEQEQLYFAMRCRLFCLEIILVRRAGRAAPGRGGEGGGGGGGAVRDGAGA